MGKLGKFVPTHEVELSTQRTGNGCVEMNLIYAEDDASIGYVDACPGEVVLPDGRKQRTLAIEFISVDKDWKRKGISTYLTEQMARIAAEDGLALQSDFNLSSERDAFWRKQAEKGRVAQVLEDARSRRKSYVLKLPPPDSLDGLFALPKTGRIPDIRFVAQKIETETDPIYDLTAYDGNKEIGSVNTHRVVCSSDIYASVRSAYVAPSHRKMGLYPELLKHLRDTVQADGCKGIVSSANSRSDDATRSWEKFAEKDPRARLVHPAFGTYVLDGLPRRGRIPMTTVRRAMKSLGRKVAACKITAESLRLGMEVEREHRDVTRGGMTATAKIAAAHLCEAGPGYYKGLKALERRLKRTKRK